MKKKSVNELDKVYSGIFGAKVFLEVRYGKVVMVMKTKRAKVEQSEATRMAQIKFGQAATYAKNVLKNPEMRAVYTLKSDIGIPAFKVAMRDYMEPPCVTEINASDYAGMAGDMIHVTAYDCFAVKQVTVTIEDSFGVVIEKGLCVQNRVTNNFDFTATVAVTSLTGVRIIAQARDFPGHFGTHCITPFE